MSSQVSSQNIRDINMPSGRLARHESRHESRLAIKSGLVLYKGGSVRIRLFVDEDAMAQGLVNGLRARGIDVLTVGEGARRRLEDDEQLEFATSQERVLYTFNTSDFYRLHTEWSTHRKAHAGIVFAPQQRYGIGEQIRRLLKLMRVRSAEEMIGNVEFLSHWGS
jgi:uncharacterized protein DUF5615